MASFPERLAALQPFWGTWYLDAPLGEGGYGKVYRVYCEENGRRRYAALKWIALPSSESELMSLRGNGLNDANIRLLYEEYTREIQREITLMSALRGTSNVVSYEAHAIIPRRNEFGWDILIRMELLMSLPQRLIKGMTVGDVVRLGIDMCRALELCARSKIIHRDIKPDNIFVDSTGAYKLGDFGVARTMRNDMTNMSVKGTPIYMAPEVYNGKAGDKSVDQYSLGLVMHRLLNAQQIPFAQTFDRVLTHGERTEAFAKRLSGKPMPPPLQGSPKLKAIICKACSFQGKKRYPSPEAMRRALEETLNDRECAEPLLSVGGPGLEGYRSSLDMIRLTGKKRMSTPILAALIGAAGLTAILAALLVLLMLPGSKPEETGTTAPVTDTPSPATDTPVPATDTPTATPTETPTATPTASPTATPDVDALLEKANALYAGSNYAEAAALYTTAAEMGNSQAQNRLGEMYELALGVQKDPVRAVYWYRQAAEQGYALAQANLGCMYENGLGIAQSFAEAVEWYRKAAAQGLAKGQYHLGYMYDYGRGTARDPEQAVYWYRQAAEQGYAAAQSDLGVLYELGDGVTQDDVQAVHWYRMSAEQGYAAGQANLANMYEKGRGVPQDYSLAVYWYQLSANQGNSRAQTNLGYMYYFGNGLEQNYEKAAEWTRLAALQGNDTAQNNLGIMYENGRGVPQDIEQAKYWYGLAAAQGNETAQANLDALDE